MRHGIWAVLDCDPTTDRGTIRRAYAARLKAMDVDADPDGFEALRDARDAALARAADPVAIEPVAADELPLPPVEAEPEPQDDAVAEAMNAHFHALETLLFPGHDAPPTPGELAEIDRHGRALLADPRLEQVDFAAGAERWFAETLAASIPRSDPLLEPAAATFGWIDRRNDYALSADAQAIVERIGATRLVALLDDPQHRLHRPWRELNRSGDRRTPFWNPKGPRREVLALIRDRFPVVESWLDPARVADVDAPNPKAGVQTWLVIFAIVTVLRIALSGSGTPDTTPSAPAAPPRIAYVADPNQIARQLTDLDLGQVAQRNPDLAAAIRSTTAAINRDGDDTRARQMIGDLSRTRLSHGLAGADDGLLRDIARFEIDVKQDFAAGNPIDCRDFTFLSDNPMLFRATRERQRALIDRVILMSDGSSLGRGNRFTIPGSIIDDLLRRTRLPERRLRDALSGKGSHEDVCRVGIAIRQSALAQGRAGMTLLRDMQPKVVGGEGARE
ncbi:MULTISPECIES: hypothetical protein [unclassified Sphingomonas]|uniref:hypothetical protein n=1 Tax=unclassified Sphingomonas TaxID=196159 RepID=UPI0006FE4E72|nr:MULTISPECIES: hypothetical protein [unclassified Sphingomonas]KQM61754.1 hypothetical protein ASE65_05935 [Sphingomonas sp. Leaf16]KQN13027.1 hypothetical protein ASE81_06950 [Sphingomonas sp. Leaf29]KQN19913.1 hypothetical protein ASE83_06875 [Sphingomonas sp. Leaf32]